MNEPAIPFAPAPLHVARETMHGDLMALVLDELKAAPDVWQKLGETEQAEVIERVRQRTRDAIAECVGLIASEGFTRLRAKVEAIAVKADIKATLSLVPNGNALHELVEAQGTHVYLVLADPSTFTGGAEAIRPDPDQGALTLDAIDRIGRDSRDRGEAA